MTAVVTWGVFAAFCFVYSGVLLGLTIEARNDPDPVPLVVQGALLTLVGLVLGVISLLTAIGVLT